MPINRRRFIRRTSAALGGSLISFGFGFGGGKESSSGFRGLRRSVGLFWGRGGTIGWFADEDGVVAVDTQFPDMATVFLDGLATRSSHKVDLQINTHHHRDHTSGNGVFRKRGVEILAQEQVPRLQREDAERRGGSTELVVAGKTFVDSWKGSFGSETIRTQHVVPAHTGGDAVVHFEKANVVHMGDLVFNRFCPFIDRPGGGSVRGWIETLETLLPQFDDETLFVFGHGTDQHGVTGRKADVLLQRDYLSAVLEAVEKGLADGRSREEILATDLLAGFPEHQTPNDRFTPAENLRVAYEELTEK